MKIFWLTGLVTFFIGCGNDNKSCAHNYIGRFRINMSEVTDSSQANFIKKKGWDTVVLISKPSGSYYFETNDHLLKTAEGSWSVKSTGIEGGCMGAIKQDNLLQETNVNAFSISINDSADHYIDLPFRREGH